MRAIYEVGAEQTWLYDPECRNGEALVDVNFQKYVKGAAKRLDSIAGKNRSAWVVLEGVFYGPAPFGNIDPRLPASIRERLMKSHKRYGHMNSFDSMIKVSRVIAAGQIRDYARVSKR